MVGLVVVSLVGCWVVAIGLFGVEFGWVLGMICSLVCIGRYF